MGTATLIGAICCLLLALQWGGTTYPWNSPKVIGLLVGFGLLVMAFVILQYFLGEGASIPLSLMRQRSVLVGSIFLFFIQTSSYIVSPQTNSSSLDIRPQILLILAIRKITSFLSTSKQCKEFR